MVSISNHTLIRLRQRLKLRNYEEIKVNIREAFNSTEELDDGFKKSDAYLPNHGFSTYIYKQLKGNVYVFSKDEDNYNLITIYLKRDENNRNQPKFLGKKTTRPIRTNRNF